MSRTVKPMHHYEEGGLESPAANSTRDPTPGEWSEYDVVKLESWEPQEGDPVYYNAAQTPRSGPPSRIILTQCVTLNPKPQNPAIR